MYLPGTAAVIDDAAAEAELVRVTGLSRPVPVAIVALLGSYVAIEAFFRRDMRTLLLRISMVLAIISLAILGVTYLREVLLVGLLALGALLITDNLGEIRRRAG